MFNINWRLIKYISLIMLDIIILLCLGYLAIRDKSIFFGTCFMIYLSFEIFIFFKIKRTLNSIF